jgi:ubiquinone/menaquinone biosynthesis C-methylase UbiE
MNKIKLDQEKYHIDYSAAHIRLMSERTLETHGQFIKSYLKSGMKILECGCGPGTMTIGIAKAVFPGEVTAIDISEKQLQLAEATAIAANVTNITFQIASINDLPFADNTFDLVFSQTLLDHLRNPLFAINEQKRVTKAGGLVTAHSGHFSRKILYPTNPILEEAINLRWQAITENGGDIDVGLKLGELFYQANLHNIHFTMFCDNRNVKAYANSFADDVFEFNYFKQLLATKKITVEKLQKFQEAWRSFAKIPYAYYGSLWGEAIGEK